jgi:hypothetical protein
MFASESTFYEKRIAGSADPFAHDFHLMAQSLKDIAPLGTRRLTADGRSVVRSHP